MDCLYGENFRDAPPEIARVSTKRQDTRSQDPDLERWLSTYGDGLPVVWYRDKATGRNMDRPGWKGLESAVDRGEVSWLVVWRLDRLGRTASGLTALFDKLRERRVNLVSIRDGLDLSTGERPGKSARNELSQDSMPPEPPGSAGVARNGAEN